MVGLASVEWIAPPPPSLRLQAQLYYNLLQYLTAPSAVVSLQTAHKNTLFTKTLCSQYYGKTKQYGFRNNSSTGAASYNLINNTLDALNNKFIVGGFSVTWQKHLIVVVTGRLWGVWVHFPRAQNSKKGGCKNAPPQNWGARAPGKVGSIGGADCGHAVRGIRCANLRTLVVVVGEHNLAFSRT